MNLSSEVFDHQAAVQTVFPAPIPLRYTQLIVALAALGCGAIQLIQGEAGDLYIGAALLGTAMTYYALRWQILALAPLSSLALIGCGLANFFAPLVMTTLEGKPVTFQLHRPDLSFGFNLLAFGVLIAVHVLYLSSPFLQAIRAEITNRLLVPMGLFIAPSPLQLLVLGMIGVGSMAYIYLVLGLTTGETFGSIGLKAIEGLFWLAYAPYLVFLYPLLGANWHRAKSLAVPLVIFSSAMLVVGSARNSRASIVMGVVGVLLGLLLGGWLGVVSPTLFRLRNTLLVAVGAALMYPVFNEFSAAMLEARSERHQVSPLNVVQSTIGAFLSGGSTETVAIGRAESTSVAQWHGGDEYYLDNTLFDRFCNLKFADNTLAIVADLNPTQRSAIAAREWEKSLSILPQPVLNAIGAGFDKESQRGSMGSFIYYLSSGRPEVIDQLSTGSYLASGWAAFAWGFPLVIALLGGCLFIGLDIFAVSQRMRSGPVISAVAVMGLFGIFTLFTTAAGAPESVAGLVEVLLREIPQQAVIYAAAFWLVKRVVPA